MTTATREDRELTDDQLETVSGGKTPTPGGPVPVPYPTLQSCGSWWIGSEPLAVAR